VAWAGVRTDDLLAAAGGLKPGAKAIDFVSAELPYVDTLTLDQARLPDAVVGQRFYLPDEREEALRERLEAWRAWREKRD
jgi:DMSO/TMAO reductase YedYZ molybdopterin-dependent catalytic subunit